VLIRVFSQYPARIQRILLALAIYALGFGLFPLLSAATATAANGRSLAPGPPPEHQGFRRHGR
jgi:hypothetical protein